MPHNTAAKRNEWRRQRGATLKAALLAEMLAKLGPRCPGCGCRFRRCRRRWVEFNHIVQPAWRREHVDGVYYRWLAYWRDWCAGELDLRCKSCNAAFRPARREDSNRPF